MRPTVPETALIVREFLKSDPGGCHFGKFLQGGKTGEIGASCPKCAAVVELLAAMTEDQRFEIYRHFRLHPA